MYDSLWKKVAALLGPRAPKAGSRLAHYPDVADIHVYQAIGPKGIPAGRVIFYRQPAAPATKAAPVPAARPVHAQPA